MLASSAVLFLLAQAASTPAPAVQPGAASTVVVAPQTARPGRRRLPTKSEYETQARTRFQAIDRNRDGRIDRGEAEKAHAEALAAREKQQSDSRAQVFARLDRNADGSISREEFDAAAKPSVAPKEAWFDSNDIDRNGTIVVNEAVARALRDFEAIDSNNNGVLSESEIRSFQARRTRSN
jgi:Ca2+-binding EF-hand superfamily protein